MFSFRAIVLLWPWNEMGMVEYTKALVWIGFHPSCWKNMSVVVVQIPREEGNTNFEFYQTMSLHSCMSKEVDNVGLEIPSDYTDRWVAISGGMFGRWKNRSYIKVSAIIINKVQLAWSDNNIMSIITRDIKAAFLIMVRGILINGMTDIWIDGHHCNGLKPFAQTEQWTWQFAESVCKCYHLEADVPQGSPKLPDVCAVHTIGLMMWVELRVEWVDGLTINNILRGVAIRKIGTRWPSNSNPAQWRRLSGCNGDT